MKEVNLSDLQVGQVAENDYCGKNEEVLISSGSIITEQHIETLKQHNFDIIYIKENLKVDNPLIDGFPELAVVKPGKEGLMQLLKNGTGDEHDKMFKDGKAPDKPVGPMLKDGAGLKKTGERTAEYKESIRTSYEQAIHRTGTILDSLANAETVSAEALRSLACRFVNLFLADRDILLNIANTKPDQDDYLYHHSLNVCILAINIAAAYGYSEQQVIEVGMGALLHDIGMLLVPKQIRFKKTKLEELEWYEIHKHPLTGYQMLKKIYGLPEAVPFAVYQCHERDNGKGYPKQRSAKMIHNYARIIAVADIFEALSSQRAYRDANIPYKAMELVVKMTRQGFIAGEFVKSLLECTSLFPVGSVVELSNKCLAKIVHASVASFSKPSVGIISDFRGAILPESKMYVEDLAKNTSIQIMRAHPTTLAGDDLMIGF